MKPIIEVHQKTNKPIFVTEVGISTHDEKHLERYMERALYAMYRAQQEGRRFKRIFLLVITDE